MWDYLGGLSSLLCSEFRVHRGDQRGWGRSGPAADYGIERAVHDVQDLHAALSLHAAGEGRLSEGTSVAGCDLGGVSGA